MIYKVKEINAFLNSSSKATSKSTGKDYKAQRSGIIKTNLKMSPRDSRRSSKPKI